MQHKPSRTSRPMPAQRLLTIDGLRIGASIPLINLLVECPIGKARQQLLASAELHGQKQSFTAFLTVCLGRALAAHPEIHQIWSWSGRLVTFHEVDLGVLVEIIYEGQPMPIIHVVKGCQGRSVASVTAELQNVRDRPLDSPVMLHAHRLKWVPLIPGWVRRGFVRCLRRWPSKMQRMAGSAVVTSLGSSGLNGHLLPVPTIYNLTLAVGGITKRHGESGVDEYVQLCVAGNHETMDGGPLTRFTSDLLQLIKDPPSDLFA